MTKKRSLLDMAKTMKAGDEPAAAVVEKPKMPSPAKKPTSKAKAAPKQSDGVVPIKDMPKEDLTAMHIRIPKATHKRLKLQHIEEGRPMNDIIHDAVDAYLRRANGPSRRQSGK